MGLFEDVLLTVCVVIFAEMILAAVISIFVPKKRRDEVVPLLTSATTVFVLLGLLVFFSNGSPSGQNWGFTVAMIGNALFFLGIMFEEIKKTRDKTRSG